MAIDLTRLVLNKLITHHVGNKHREEQNILSNDISIVDEASLEYLLQYFLVSLKMEENFCFNHAVEVELNDTYSIIRGIFSNGDDFIDASKNLAKLLYEQSTHPKINEGELNIAHFSKAILDGETVDAIGIFKSETNVPFIKMESEHSKFKINHDYGFELKGIDKACLIFNTEAEEGYRILILDGSNSSGEAQYWRDDFLNVKPICNDYHQTREFLGITKNYLTTQLSEEFEVNKADKIDMLNRSMDYFKTHENFKRDEFEEEVLKDKELIESFQSFDSNYRAEYDIDLADEFGISNHAVKKQARIFKSVLKLDKNFHIYIHGDRELIEQGTDPDGRKFYKIYFEKEV